MKKTIVRYKHAIIALIMVVLNGVGVSASTPWTVNPSDYRYDMSLYLDVAFAASEMDYSLYDVGVFCGDECRGVAEVLPLSNGKSCLYVRVRSNQESGETMTFKYYDKSTQTSFDVDNVSFVFESNGRLGYPSDTHKVTIIRHYDVVITAGDGGTVNHSGGRIAEGTELIVTASPNEGYHFESWADGSTENPRTIIVNEDKTLSAQFVVNTYNLNYTVDGVAYKEYTVDYGTAITPEPIPEKEGHTFSGWEGLPETMPAHDVTASGSFTINSYNAVFKIGEEVIETQTVVFGQPVTAPDAPEKEGHTFAGWQNVPAAMPAHDIEILGTYTVNQYKLTYNVDGEMYKEYTVDYGTAITPESAPEKEGHTFSGWEGLPETMPAHDVTASGSFTINSYNAVFKIGDEVIETQTVVFGQPVTAPAAPEKEGHTFAGWQDVPAAMPAHDIEILGTYTVNQYKLTYNVDGEMYKEYTVDYGTAITPEPIPEKEGHTFSGWEGLPEKMPAHDVTASGSFSINSYNAVFKIGDEVIETQTVVFGQPVTAPAAPEKEGHTFAGWQNVPAAMPAHDVEILGTYTVNQYKLTYNVDGEMYKEYTIDYGTAITPEPIPEKEGHTFSGWEGLPETMPAHDVTASGSFTINSYKAVFKIGDEVIETQTVVFGQPVTAPAAPEKEGHTFAGWQDVPAAMPAHDVEILGTYTVNQYKLTYNVDGEMYKEYTVDYGTAITPEPIPEKEGHTFSGWEGLPATMPAHDVTVSGSFSINSYNAVFKIGDEVIETQTVVFGQPVTAPDAPEKEGHTFAGWQNVPAAMPAHDVEILGTYTVNQYKLTYNVDGEMYKEYTVDYGTAITPEPIPEREGHTFSGWEGLPETMPAHDVIVDGTFVVNKYMLTLYLNNEVYSSEEIEFGAKLSIEDPVVPDGMKFDGWIEEIPEIMPAYDLEIHGTYSDLNSIVSVSLDKEANVTIYSINGVLICKNTKWAEISDKLDNGVYIINGQKVIIGK